MKILSMIVNLYFMSLLNRLSCVPCMPAWSTCPRPNVPKACQRRANFSTCRANVSNGVPIFQPRLPKGVPIFQPIFKRIFKFLSFQIMLNTCKFQEYLGKSRKFTSRKKEFKFWYLQNFIKEKPYQSKPFDIVFDGAREINPAIIRLAQNEAEYTFLIYLILYSVCKKAYLEKHTSCTQ